MVPYFHLKKSKSEGYPHKDSNYLGKSMFQKKDLK